MRISIKAIVVSNDLLHYPSFDDYKNNNNNKPNLPNYK